MTSYATVDRVEKTPAGFFYDCMVVLEVERVQISVRPVEMMYEVPTFMDDVPSYMFGQLKETIEEGAVYSVVHDNGKVTQIIGIERDERQRRAEFIKSLEESFDEEE